MTPKHSPNAPPAGIQDPAAQEFAGQAQGEGPPTGTGRPRVPDAIGRLYLCVDDRYFFPDRTLAFIDDGDRIRVRTENRAVLQSIVAIAESRGWRVLALKGTEAFRQGMWREAALRGIEVRGYEPTPTEVLQVQRALKHSQPVREPEQSSVRQAPPVNGAAAATHDDSSMQAIQGVLVAAAAAPYRFDPSQRMSFYVQLRTEVGERTIWGADLERALAESASRPRIGAEVVLTQHGTHPVNVRVTERNTGGEPIGERKVVAQRVRWRIETPDHLRAMARHAQQVRAGETLSDAALVRHSELKAAADCLRLAQQYAHRLTSDQGAQERLMQLIRERMADALERGQFIHLPQRRSRSMQQHPRQRTGRDREEPSYERL